MYSGRRNPNQDIGLEKMTIVNLDADNGNGETLVVLYNPQSYVRKRSVEYQPVQELGAEFPKLQYNGGGIEELSFELFFDSVSAGEEVKGKNGEDKLKNEFKQNQGKILKEKTVDVRTYTQKIYDLMTIEADAHRPPMLSISWGSMEFTGFLSSCEQNFTKFSSNGNPVRAVLNCQFIRCSDGKEAALNPKQSPDTTKYRTVRQGDSLWAMAQKEYGDASQWREIAVANGIVNPRTLRSGEMLTVPGLV